MNTLSLSENRGHTLLVGAPYTAEAEVVASLARFLDLGSEAARRLLDDDEALVARLIDLGAPPLVHTYPSGGAVCVFEHAGRFTVTHPQVNKALALAVALISVAEMISHR